VLWFGVRLAVDEARDVRFGRALERGRMIFHMDTRNQTLYTLVPDLIYMGFVIPNNRMRIPVLVLAARFSDKNF
jgi:hypothetical protein